MTFLCYVLLSSIMTSILGSRFTYIGGAWGVKFARPIRAINRQNWHQSNNMFGSYPDRLGLYRFTMFGCLKHNYNEGCIVCKPRMFLLIRGIGNRQMAVCHHTCPAGFYGVRSTHFNKCSKCKISNCVSCFTRDYCTKCRPGFYLHKGKCVTNCPPALHQNSITQHCQSEVDCVVGEWSTWSSCMRRQISGVICRKTKKRRTRIVLQAPSTGGKKCPKLKQRKMCRSSLPFKCPVKHKKNRHYKDHKRKRVATNTLTRAGGNQQRSREFGVLRKNTLE